MRFLKTLFWALVAVFIALFVRSNWFNVTLNLWNDIRVDINLPLLLALMFLAGFVPPLLLYRGRMWHLRRRLEAKERQQPIPPQQPASEDEAQTP